MYGMGISGVRGTSGGGLVLVPEAVGGLHEAGVVRGAGMLASFYLLSQAMKTLPLGTAYAVWTGIGAVGSVAVGILVFKEPVTAARMFFTVLLLAGIIGIKLTSAH